jgi:hypothetical protein
VVDLWKVSARPETVKLTVKKSNASQVCHMSGCQTAKSKCRAYPSKETDEEEEPLFAVEHRQEPKWVGSFVHGRLEGGDSCRGILADAHLLMWWRVVCFWGVSRISDLFLTGMVHDEGGPSEA